MEPRAIPRCPWCSAELGPPTDDRCPSCGAALVSVGDQNLPGLTSIDPEVIIRGRTGAGRKRSKLMTWISGEADDEPLPPGGPDALAPPAADVRREMLRIELESEGIVPPADGAETSAADGGNANAAADGAHAAAAEAGADAEPADREAPDNAAVDAP